jgi:hypothetical protein
LAIRILLNIVVLVEKSKTEIGQDQQQGDCHASPHDHPANVATIKVAGFVIAAVTHCRTNEVDQEEREPSKP